MNRFCHSNVLFCLFAGLQGFFIQAGYAENYPLQAYESECKSMVLMDAGSSGSRVMSYQFKRLYGTSQYELIRQTSLVESEPPLSYGKRLPGHLIGEMSSLYQLKSGDCIPKTEVFVGGTAGLRHRAVILKNHGKPLLSADLVLKRVAIELYRQGVPGNYPENVRLLTGLEEAAFTWLGVNTLRGQLKSEKLQYGIVELGGGSVQMAFRVRKDEQNSLYRRAASEIPSSAVNIKRFWRYPQPDIEVYGESYSGLGINQAYDDLLRLENVTSLSKVCSEYQSCSEVVDKLFERPGSLRKDRRRPLLYTSMPKVFHLNGYFYDRTVALGLPNIQTPRMLQLAARYVCGLKPDGVHERLQGHYRSDNQFFSEFIKLHNQPPPLEEDFSSSGEPRKPLAERMCAEFVYMAELLSRLGLKPDTHLLVSKSVSYKGHSYGLSWPLGYSIARANDWLKVKEE
ncbi:hypothetical protein GZ78_05250 [Endozoicomonas numazuensis]|uniref:GDA1/CD39 family protein n=1 Tax=Endozoicomonas numazuensis TaxID=1137799 RepID=A0A081NLP7_9GAMM|nr:hypothetical protein GZ78_05250 [Endozoicomonas numazuensis]